MEKIDWLIDKLQRQHEAGARAADMLTTLQLLQTELNQQVVSSDNVNKTITVVMPAPKWNMSASDALAAYETESLHSTDEEKVVFELEPFIHAEVPDEAESPAVVTIAPEIYSSYLPEIKEAVPPIVEQQEPEPLVITVQPAIMPQPAPPVVVPLSVEAVEMKSPAIQTNQRSLNDLLEKPADELFTRLHEPIKDLKKAISINDRYQYITNLFSGDEAMYDRSIKTINSFNIISEAEYWIRRELAVKHGWRENDPLVKQFYHLVSRRFS